jgi:hypothetical protein
MKAAPGENPETALAVDDASTAEPQPKAVLTEGEQAAFDRVLATFPDATVLPFEPKTVLEVADEALTEDERRSSWRAVELRDHLHPADERDAPALLRRSDGVGLLYIGKRNEVHGPYESGKSLVAAVAALETIRAGGVTVWVDFEDSPRSLAGRLLALGIAEDEILAGFRYIQPAEPLTSGTEIDLRLELVGASLVVIDAANEAMAAAGLDPNVNRDIASWYAKVPRLAIAAGASLLVLDHVAKDPERQRGAVGGAHKQAAIDGASYKLEVVRPFGRGSAGLIRLRLTKDRGGYLRGLLGSAKEPVAAEIAIDGTDPQSLVVELKPPSESSEDWRPTGLMEKVSRFLEDEAEPVSERVIVDHVAGKQTYVRQATAALVEGKYVRREPGPRGAHLHTSVRPYREDG